MLQFDGLTLEDIRVYAVDPVDARVIDISQGGMAVETIVPLHMGEQYRFKISVANSSVSLDGEVIRCSLQQLSEDVEGHNVPVYLNGVRFLIQRNPLEISLLEVLHANVVGERRTSPRLKPQMMMRVEIAHPLNSIIKELGEDGLTMESDIIPDMDEERNLLLQAGYETLILPTRVLHVSKKEGFDSYNTRLEFTSVGEHESAVLSALAAISNPEE
ncbi:MAG: PilZ domain-containing protein [Acidobacteriota bacterium]|nr:PilZ domain-containing protein [Acidobacteriota bacterium]